jgi:hypothetical protein
MFVAANIAVNTTISASFGALTCLAVAILLGLPGDIGPVLNGGWAEAVLCCSQLRQVACECVG